MMDSLFQMGLSNAGFSLALALVATAVGAATKRARIAHLLWLLVFVKLVTPPVVTIPVGIFPEQVRQVAAVSDVPAGTSRAEASAAASVPTQPALTAGESIANRTDTEAAPAETPSFLPAMAAITASVGRANPWLATLWALGGAMVLAWSLVRVIRFSRLLATETEPASPEIQAAAAKTAKRLGLSAVPTICTTSAHLSPMVWWAGGRVRVVLPTALLNQMDAQQSQWILAHELAHVRRYDYLVRWLEWAACVCFWWNPVVWWAQRKLRVAEEICCDDLVISCLNPKPKHYANSLLTAVEFLAQPALRPPAMASEINSGGVLERRFKMILSNTTNRTNSRWLQVGILLCATVVLPLGLASAQENQRASNGGITRTRIAEALMNNGIPRDQVQDVMKTLRPIMNEIESEGDAFALNPRIHRRLASLGLAPEQIRAVVRIARRLGGALNQQAQQKQQIVDSGVRTGIQAFVEAGAITQADARARIAAYRRRVAQQQQAAEQETALANATTRIRAAIANGTLTPQAGRAKLAAYKERLAQEANAQQIARATARVRAAVTAGTMTPEEGRAALAAYRQRLAQSQTTTSPKTEPMLESDIEGAVEGALTAFVEAGQITEADAQAGLSAYREAMTPRADTADLRARYQVAVQRVRAAVANGTMTPEEGRAKLAAYRERLAQAAQ